MSTAALLLTACGGGSSSNSTVQTQAATTPTSTVQVSSTEKLLTDGLYRVSYGTGDASEKIDQSAFVTKIDTSIQSKEYGTMTNQFYAGLNPLERYSVFHEISQLTKGLATNHMKSFVFSYSEVLESRVVRSSLNDSLSFDLAVGWLPESSSTGVAAYNVWTVKLLPSDISGKTISEVLKTIKPKSKSFENIALTGNFPTGSSSYSLTFESKTDVIYNERTLFAYGKREFLNTTFCRYKASDGSIINLQFEANGKINIYHNLLGKCDGAKPGNLIGTGTWTDEKISGLEYTFFKFPENIPVSRYDSTFDQASYDNGIRIGTRWDYSADGVHNTYPQADVYVIPKGTVVVKTSGILNKIAADAVKSSAGWK